MEHPVFVRCYCAPPLNRQEILRYAGVAIPTAELSALLEEAAQEAEGHISCRVCWQEISLPEQEEEPIPGFSLPDSRLLRQHLPGCHAMVLFAATVGMDFDRLIARHAKLSPARALMLQALGAERVEALCDTFCEEIRQQQEVHGLHTLPRFSPGYGSLPLTLQKEIFQILNCSGKIGLTLNDSLLMSPSKSVTAFIGIRTCPIPAHSGGCKNCAKTDCTFRRNV